MPSGFFYVNQDNYCVVKVDEHPDHQYLYSDSATSCIIVVIWGENVTGDSIAALAHLSRPIRFDYFFDCICSTFVGPVNLWAQGGNPPDQEASINNINTLINWLNNQSVERFEKVNSKDKPSWFIEQASLQLGGGNPQKENRGSLGIDLVNGVVSNKGFDLTLNQRDPGSTSGIQTLFAVFGLRITPKVWLWNANKSFPKGLTDQLVVAAREKEWVKILDMDDKEILNKYSSTPKYEPIWFVPTLRQSAEFVKGYSE